MEVNLTEDVELFQDEDFCYICAGDQLRKIKGLAPNILVTLPRKTTRHELEIHACPDCDGGVVLLGGRKEL